VVKLGCWISIIETENATYLKGVFSRRYFRLNYSPKFPGIFQGEYIAFLFIQSLIKVYESIL
jgi:penicillin-binding protein-related factor A (putative recombinase)